MRLGGSEKPNIVIILADDLGYGDVSCLNPAGKIRTPHIDRLSTEGCIFTDAHSSSAVCSPSRYNLLTGRYNWRTTLQAGIVRQYGDPLIDSTRITLPQFLRESGYLTGAIGKWHLGMGWDFVPTSEFMPHGDMFGQADLPENPQIGCETRRLWDDAFSRRTKGGPTTRGFDWYFGVDVPNWPPYCFIENDRTVGVPSEYLPERLFNHNQASTPGPAVAHWNFEQLLPEWVRQTKRFVSRALHERKPFFLYVALTSPHTPLAPNAEWRYASGLSSPYADFVMETDATVGSMLGHLRDVGIDEDTIVIFTSDNGMARYVGADELEAQGHRPSANFRGYKGDAWDGGHRVPFIARWPGHIVPGSTCSDLVCLGDLFRTCADIIGFNVPDRAGEDSVTIAKMLPRWGSEPGGSLATRKNHSAPPDDAPAKGRNYVVHHSMRGKFAIRDRRWKLVLCAGSGGIWSLTDEEAEEQGMPPIQLYDMEADPSETTNVFQREPDTVRRMLSALRDMVDRGRSTPGKPQQNDTEIDIWKTKHTVEQDESELDER